MCKFSYFFWSIRDSGVIQLGATFLPLPNSIRLPPVRETCAEKGDTYASFLENITDEMRWHNGLARTACVSCASFG